MTVQGKADTSSAKKIATEEKSGTTGGILDGLG